MFGIGITLYGSRSQLRACARADDAAEPSAERECAESKVEDDGESAKGYAFSRILPDKRRGRNPKKVMGDSSEN
jgi:hypothetical protein